VTVDEELNKLEDDLRRLKIEYEVYFNGATPRPPRDTLFKVETLIKRYSSDQSKLNFAQRFRFTSLAQKYAVQSQLWRRKLQEKEEGRSLSGPLTRAIEKMKKPMADSIMRIVCTDPDAEAEEITQLLEAMKRARIQAGESIRNLDPAAFHQFIKEKTRQIKKSLDCNRVQFSVSIEGGKVKFKAARAE
jgi:predicted CopG family antitoxin